MYTEYVDGIAGAQDAQDAQDVEMAKEDGTDTGAIRINKLDCPLTLLARTRQIRWMLIKPCVDLIVQKGLEPAASSSHYLYPYFINYNYRPQSKEYGVLRTCDEWSN